MAKSKPKIQKRLAKIVMASLLLSGVLPGMMSPSVAEAGAAPVYGTVTKDGSSKSVKITSLNTYGYGYGNVIFEKNTYRDDKVFQQTLAEGYHSTLNLPESSSLYAFDGARIFGGTVQDNAVSVEGGTLYDNVVGGSIGGGYYYTLDVLKHTVDNNQVEINGATVYGYVIGGGHAGAYYNEVAKKVSVTVSNNKVKINGGKVGKAIGGIAGDDYGFYSAVPNGKVTNNTVTIKAGTVGQAFGGMGYGVYEENDDGLEGLDRKLISPTTVNENEVHVEGGSVTGFGGYALTSRKVSRVIMGSVVGGVANGGDATGNKVFISKEAQIDGMMGMSSTGIVAGGLAIEGDAKKNEVNISGGNLGGISNSDSGGSFTIDGSPDSSDSGSIPAAPVFIAGGLSTKVADDNIVTISGGKADGATIYGGAALFDEGSSGSGNTVTISGKDTSIENAVIIGGGLYLNSYGVAVAPSDDASEPVMPVIKADNNKVNVLTEAHPLAIFGGLAGFDMGKYSIKSGTGNTLNVAAKGVTAYTVGGFQNMNFYLPKDIKKNDTMLTIKTHANSEEMEKSFGQINRVNIAALQAFYVSKYDMKTIMEKTQQIRKAGEETDQETIDAILKETVKPTDLKGVTFGVAALQGVNLKKGDKVTLIHDDNGLDTDPGEPKTTSSKELGKAEFLQQNNMTTEEKYELSIKKEGKNSIVTTVDDIIENETDPDARKSPVETRIGVMNMINNAGDMLAGQGMSNAAAAAAGKSDGAGFNSFAAVNYGQIRGESGSHVTNKGIGLNLGFARELENKSGKLLFGPVVEYGHGSYDSYQDNGMKADGKASYWGIGVIAKQTNNSGFYYEGSLRVGRTKSDYGSDSIVANSHISYDSSATYWAAHLGAGMLRDIGHDNTLDYYGKYFYSHTGSDSTTIYRNGEDFDRVDFDGVNSNRIRLGARVTHALNERNKIYGGLAYQYEFSGEARATYRQGSAPSPSMKGSSGMIELGWQVKPGSKSPMTIDLGVTGWVGKQRGITANVQANWTF